jgi:resuscitation-promoting factor RpfB
MKCNSFRWQSKLPGLLFLLIGLCLLSLAACTPSQPALETIKVVIQVDGKQILTSVPTGKTVQNIIDDQKIYLNALDRIDPTALTPVTQPVTIRITRVREAFETQVKTIPFEPQTVYNEALPKGQSMNIQEGVNGSENITYRKVFENEVEISRSVVKTEIIKAPVPQIQMVGVQAPIAPVDIQGTIVYLTAGNAWVIQKSTGERRPVLTSGDLDGRIFSLSPTGNWLLFTRKIADAPKDEINSLWMLDISQKNTKPIDLRVKNVVHFADWKPGAGLTIAFSTVEPRATAPGWQANNDVQMITFNSTGGIVKKDQIIDSNNGGIYGWWGTNFAWSPDGEMLAYARPDEIGWVDFVGKKLVSLYQMTPYQTGSDWAWTTGLSWSPDRKLLYTVSHSPKSGLDNNEASPYFDLSAIMVADNPTVVSLNIRSGMFAYPVPSTTLMGNRFMVAYLQAIFPEQSNTSRYQLMVMDQDGSNSRKLFPREGSQGIEPQQIIWGPKPGEGADPWIALTYQGNLNLINVNTGVTQQITGDGSVKRIDWK